MYVKATRILMEKEHAVHIFAGHLSRVKFIWHCLFLLVVSAVFVNAKECSFQNTVVFIKP